MASFMTDISCFKFFLSTALKMSGGTSSNAQITKLMKTQRIIWMTYVTGFLTEARLFLEQVLKTIGEIELAQVHTSFIFNV